MLGQTYCLRVITEYLKSKNINFEYCSAKVSHGFYDHGCRIDIGEDLKMSIQTHPMVTGEAFAETAIQNMKTKTMNNSLFNYHGDVKRHYTPEKLFSHIEQVLEAKNNPTNLIDDSSSEDL